MKITYEKIIDSMKAAFFERCGEKAEAFSDTSARLEAAASELYSLACRGDYILNQAFPQTASGEYLDFHAQLRDITRKEKSFARGTLTFFVNEAAAVDITVAQGTVCSKAGKPFVQFETTESAVLPAGETQVSVAARALDGGWEYNAKAGEVTVMVNAPSGIDGVTNSEAFTGGSDIETDEALRKRILASYGMPQSGFSLETIRTALLKKDFLLDCRVTCTNGSLKVLVRLKAGTDFNAAESEIVDDLAAAFLTDCSVTVAEAQPQTYSLNIEINASKDDEGIAERVSGAVAEYVSSLGIEEPLYLNRVAYLVSVIDGVKYCEVSSPEAETGYVICPADSYLTPEEITVNTYEQHI
ncbi:MAG: baseplate J/gp47 family protein [Eubacterium sp.]|nr:baseplate J/gp47 family protein [Eubacterium sp.]